MDRFTGLIGLVVILGLAVLMSKDRKAINLRLVLSGLALQLGLAIFILKTSLGQSIFGTLGAWITKLLEFSDKGAAFVFGFIVNQELLDKVMGPGNSFVFMFKIMPTIIFVAVLVSIAYHIVFAILVV